MGILNSVNVKDISHYNYGKYVCDFTQFALSLMPSSW